MERELIKLQSTPKAIGAYSPLVKFDKLLYSSGQIALNPETNELVSGGIEEETKTVLKNIYSMLKQAGSSFENLLKVSIFLTDLRSFSKVDQLYKEMFKGSFPARTTLEVSSLPKGALIEIDFVAYSS